MTCWQPLSTGKKVDSPPKRWLNLPVMVLYWTHFHVEFNVLGGLNTLDRLQVTLTQKHRFECLLLWLHATDSNCLRWFQNMFTGPCREAVVRICSYTSGQEKRNRSTAALIWPNIMKINVLLDRSCRLTWNLVLGPELWYFCDAHINHVTTSWLRQSRWK